MDLLYLLGHGSRRDNVEIRYSLRSIEKWCKGYERVFIVGQCPEWLRNVTYIPCPDDQGYSHKNMMKKIIYACKNSDISEDFVMQADDHFYVRPYDFRKIKPYEKGELRSELWHPDSDIVYQQSIVDTRKWLEKHGYPYRNGSQHCGMWFKKSLWLQIEEEMLKPAFLFPYGLESSSIMAAALNKHLGIPYEYRKDCKVLSFADENALKEKIGENFCFSIYDGAFSYGIEKILAKWFPNKSRYEI